MVKVQAPALSMEASGQIGGSMVFSSWKGRAYVRSLVKPSNPRSALQTGIRAAMKFLTQAWAGLTAPNQATWADPAANANISPFNSFIKTNMLDWRNGHGLTKEYVHDYGDPAAVLSAFTATGGARHVTLALTCATWDSEWAYMICRSQVTGFTPSWANCIAVIPLIAATAHSYIDSVLPAGEYFYRAATLSYSGKIGTFFAQQAGTAT